ncbi:MAG TPA: hypothetical protein PKM25_11405 [Candidatus Ozemobacteraceae bacterium]|nr:hypothetical protein [Candidatus Ozemobacteraceae bacterium]
MNYDRPRGRSPGVTLIEIICAFLIFMIATLGASGLLSFGHRGTQKDFRMVAAQEILSDRMNRLALVPYASLTTSITAEPVVFSSDGVAGRFLWGVPYGLATNTRAGSFNVDITLRHQPVTFGVQPFNIVTSVGYASTTPSTFAFDSFDATYREYTGVDATRPFEVIKFLTTVKWGEPNGVSRNIQAVSFIANLQGAF